MNLVFLTSESTHHYYLINEIHKAFPVRMVFFQTSHVIPQQPLARKLAKLFNVAKYNQLARGLIYRILFGREVVVQEQYEKKVFFGDTTPGLNPAIASQTVVSFNQPETVEKVKKENPDIIIVFGTDILKGEILDVAKLNIFNVHRGILPNYRGGCVDLWAFYNQDFKNIGTTVHVCSKSLDGGDIVGQRFYQLQKGDRFYMLRYKTTVLAVEILKDVLNKFNQKAVEYKKQGAGKTWSAKSLTLSKEITARRNFNHHVNSL